ncbi:hypothetical protein MJ585_22740 [Klebsiella pneumoniae]|nr:hypothetical protein MJ585_22740 [Klebsiella pneumoniae]
MEFIVERQRLDDPFRPKWRWWYTGMAQWLQMTLAARFLRDCRQYRVPLPASFIWDMFRAS